MALEALGRGAPPRRPGTREGPPGAREGSAEGDEETGALRQPRGEPGPPWTERRWGVRSVRQAPAAEAARRARVAKALAPLEALNPRGGGHQRLETGAACRQAVVALGPEQPVEPLGGWRLPRQTPPRPVRASRGQPARVDHERHAPGAGCGDAAAGAAALRRVGGRG